MRIQILILGFKEIIVYKIDKNLLNYGVDMYVVFNFTKKYWLKIPKFGQCSIIIVSLLHIPVSFLALELYHQSDATNVVPVKYRDSWHSWKILRKPCCL